MGHNNLLRENDWVEPVAKYKFAVFKRRIESKRFQKLEKNGDALNKLTIENRKCWIQ